MKNRPNNIIIVVNFKLARALLAELEPLGLEFKAIMSK